MRFTKMHGTGNDFVVVSLFEQPVRQPEVMARELCRRHFGVGSDGLILVQPAEDADLAMRIFNADGSEAEMCGNGIRCVAKYAYDHGLCRKKVLTIETGAGLRTVRLTLSDGLATGATVNMGAPRLRRRDIPMAGPDDPQVVDEDLPLEGTTLRVTCVSMGNPHCVVPVSSIRDTPWQDLGPRIERHPAFPQRTNVHFVERVGRGELKAVTWERGSGATLACGTGACAVCVAMHLLGAAERAVRVHLPGGELAVEWSSGDNCVHMTGPAVEVFSGEWPG